MHRIHTEILSKKEKRQLWDEIIADYLSSGQSVRSYSEAHGLKSDHLSYYVSSHKRKQQNKSTAFIPLELPKASHATIDIRSGGLTVSVPLNASKTILETLFTVLNKSC